MFILVTSLFIFFLTWSWECQLFFSRNLWRFLFIMVLVVYSLQDSCCLLTISLSRYRHDIPDFCLFTVTRFAYEVDQSANSGIWVSSSEGHYHNWTSCWWLCFFFASLPRRSIQLSWFSVWTLPRRCRMYVFYVVLALLGCNLFV